MGGIFGYYQWLDAWEDKSNEMHEVATEWLGEDFDPTRVELDELNWRLAQAFKRAPKKPRKPRKPRKHP